MPIRSTFFRFTTNMNFKMVHSQTKCYSRKQKRIFDVFLYYELGLFENIIFHQRQQTIITIIEKIFLSLRLRLLHFYIIKQRTHLNHVRYNEVQ